MITTVKFGNDTNTVDVYYTDQPPRKMSLEQFAEEFSINWGDEEQLIAEGKLDRFSKVDHVEICSQDEFLEGGVKLIDSPGLEEAYTRTKTIDEFVPKANAIIFILDAVSLFSNAEREYIAENFAGKHLRNVFFVVNRVDLLNEGQLDVSVKPTARAALEDIFTDENGVFDQKLYNDRVFFTSARPALCAKTDVPYTVIVGHREIEIPFPIEETGMPEFESALKDFLNSDERIRLALYGKLMQIARGYRTKVQERDELHIHFDALTKQISKYAQALENLIPAVEKMFQILVEENERLSKKLFQYLCGYVQNNLPDVLKYSDLSKACSVKYWEKIQLINENKRCEYVDAIITALQDIVAGEMNKWGMKLPEVFADDELYFEQISHDISNQLEEIDARWFEAKNSEVLRKNSSWPSFDHYISPIETALTVAISCFSVKLMGWHVAVLTISNSADKIIHFCINGFCESFLQAIQDGEVEIRKELLTVFFKNRQYFEDIQYWKKEIMEYKHALPEQIEECERNLDTTAKRLLKQETSLAKMSQILGDTYSAIFERACNDEVIRQLCETADGSTNLIFNKRGCPT